MDSILPLPKTKNGWIAGLTLAIVMFLVYYIPFLNKSFYELLRETYLDSHVFVKFELSSDSVASADGKLQSLNIYADIPNYAGTIGTQPLYIRIKYPCGNSERLENLRVSLYSGKEASFSRLLLLPGFVAESNDAFVNSVTIDEIVPCEEYLVRMSFIPPAEDYDIGELRLLISTENGSEDRTPQKSGATTSDIKSTVIMIVLAQLLLPPWSNGFILFLALFASYLFEHASKDESNENISLKQLWSNLWKGGLFGFGIAAWIWIFIDTQNLLFLIAFPLVLIILFSKPWRRK
ncbi:MAG: hypothetical protein IPG44_17285 [Anaerolineales bacterium]|nr:hypothetical protein [Anaerolineales bacterium]